MNTDTHLIHPIETTIRSQFPIFTNNPDLVFLDSASSAQKPQYVIDAVTTYMEHDYANIHRGAYALSQRSETMIDETRARTAKRLGAGEDEIIFTKNSTDASNILIASFIASGVVSDGAVIYLCRSDHHASIVPWQSAQQTLQAQGLHVQLKRYDCGEYTTNQFEDATIVMVPHVSNVLGQVNEIRTLKSYLPRDTYLCVDGSQSLPHVHCDMQTLGCDFFRATGHKLGAYPGVGVLWGKSDHLKRLTPGFGGGGAVESVSIDGYSLQGAPDKFEPGTPNLSAIKSLGAALERAQQMGGSIVGWYTLLDDLDKQLVAVAHSRITRLNSLGISCTQLGQTQRSDEKKVTQIALISLQFEEGTKMQGLNRHLAKHNIAVRVGGLCAQPLHAAVANNLPSLRLSTRVYSTIDDINRAFDCIEQFFQ